MELSRGFHVLTSRVPGPQVRPPAPTTRSNRRAPCRLRPSRRSTPQPRATAGDNRGAFAFTFYRAAIGAGRNRVALARSPHGQADGQNGFALKFLFLRVNDGSVRVRSLGDGCPALRLRPARKRWLRFIACLGNFGVNGARQNNGDGCRPGS